MMSLVADDPLALTLLRSDELERRRRADHLLAEVTTLRDSCTALESRAQEMRDQLSSASSAHTVHDSFVVLTSEAARRQMGVWVASETELPGGIRRLIVRLSNDDTTYTVTLEEAADGLLTTATHDMPTGLDVPQVVRQRTAVGTPDQVVAVVQALSSRCEALCQRRRQVAELCEVMPSRKLNIWHDDVFLDIRLRLRVTSFSKGRFQVELQLVYDHADRLPLKCCILEPTGADMTPDDRQELTRITRLFLEKSLPDAFIEAFQ